MRWELRALIVLTAVVIGIGFNRAGEAGAGSSESSGVSSNRDGASTSDEVIVAGGGAEAGKRNAIQML